MAITTALSNAFKLELLKGNHDFDNDTFRVALIKETPTGTYRCRNSSILRVRVRSSLWYWIY